MSKKSITLKDGGFVKLTNLYNEREILQNTGVYNKLLFPKNAKFFLRDARCVSSSARS